MQRLGYLIALFLLPLGAALAEDIWCRECKNWVFAESTATGLVHRSETHPDRDVWYCDACGDFVVPGYCRHKPQICPLCNLPYTGEPGVHSECRKYKCGSCGKIYDKPADGSTPAKCTDCLERVGGNEADPWWVEYRHWLAGGLFLLFVLIGSAIYLLVSRKRRKAADGAASAPAFEFAADGRPLGIELVPGELVCSKKSFESGGTAEGRPAKYFDGGEWKDAFIKRILPGKSISLNQLRSSLEFEANVLKRLQETGFAPGLIRDVEETEIGGEKWIYFTMTRAAGVPWPDYGVPWPDKEENLGGETRMALFSLCEALEAFHAAGIGHHDLKPGNIFFDRETHEVTILDLGAAWDDKGLLVNPIGNTLPGTKPWIPPENDGKRLADLSVKSDNFVYGLIFCEAFTRRISHPQHSARFLAHVAADREKIREELSKNLSGKLADAVIDGLLNMDCRRRMPLAQFRELLREEWKVDLQ